MRPQRHALPPCDGLRVARPARAYGPWSTVASRQRRCTREGLLDRILAVLQGELADAGRIDREARDPLPRPGADQHDPHADPPPRTSLSHKA